MKIVYQSVTRFSNEILGVKGLKKDFTSHRNLSKTILISMFMRHTNLPSVFLPMILYATQTLAGANDIRHAVNVLIVGGDTCMYAIAVDTSICMLPPSGAELTKDICES